MIRTNSNTNGTLSRNHIHINCVTKADVISSTKKLKNRCTAGDDQFPVFLIKDYAYVLAAPLPKIFNLALQTSTFPNIWKLTKIIPVLKSGDASNIWEN